MLVSAALAQSYAAYRSRLLNGPGGLYDATPLGPCPDDPSIPWQVRGETVPFIRRFPFSHCDDDPSTPSTFLHVSRLVVRDIAGDPAALDGSPILQIHHEGSLTYASFALLSAVCEYVITLDRGALELALRIARSLQRLGSHAPGYGERLAAPWGYVLDADAVDEYDADANFCRWLADPNNARTLEPSFDRYASILSCLSFAHRVIRDAERDYAGGGDPDWPDEAHRQLREEVLEAIAERVKVCQRFVSARSQYKLRRGDGTGVARGRYCFQLAYPLSRIAASVLGGSPGQHLPAFKTALLREAFLLLDPALGLDAAAAALTGRVLESLASAILPRVLGVLRDTLSRVNYLEMLTRIFREVYDIQVVRAVYNDLQRELRDQLGGAILRAARVFLSRDELDPQANAFLAEALYRHYTRDALDPRPNSPRFDFAAVRAPLSILVDQLPALTLPARRLQFATPGGPFWNPRTWSVDLPAVMLDQSETERLRGSVGVDLGFTPSFLSDLFAVESGHPADTVLLWGAGTGEALGGIASDRGAVSGLAFSPPQGTPPRSRYLATAHWAGGARLRDMGSGETWAVGADTGPVHAVAFSPDATLLATGGEDGVVRVWQTGSRAIARELRGHAGPAHAVAFIATSPPRPELLLASAGRDATIRVWDASTGQARQVVAGHTGPVNALAGLSGITLVPGTDTFERRELGSAWVPVSGTWEIAAGRLHCREESDGATATFRATWPGAGYSVEATVYLGAEGVALGVVARYSDAGGHYYAEIQRGARADTVRLVKVEGGGQTQLATAPLPTAGRSSYRLTLSVDDREVTGGGGRPANQATLRVLVDGVERLLARDDAPLLSTGRTGARMGNGGSRDQITAAWDDFAVLDPLALPFADEFGRAALGPDWAERVGRWEINADERLQPTDPREGAIATFTGRPPSADYFVESAVRSDRAGDRLGLVGRLLDQDNYYYALLAPGEAEQTLTLGRVGGGEDTVLGTTALAAPTGADHLLRLSFAGQSVAVAVAGVERLRVTDASLQQPGAAGVILGSGRGPRGSATWDRFRVDRLALADTFNRGDLGRGWVQVREAWEITADRLHPVREQEGALATFAPRLSVADYAVECVVRAPAGAELAVVARHDGVASEDLFDRTDSQAAGPGWTPVRGTWRVSGRRLVAQPDGGSAVATFSSNRVTGSSYVVEADVLAAAEGVQLGVVARCAGPDDFYYALLTPSDRTGRLRLGKVVGGVDTSLADVACPASLNTAHTVRLVVDGSKLQAVVGSRRTARVEDQSLRAGPPGAVFAAGSAGDASWSRFKVAADSYYYAQVTYGDVTGTLRLGRVLLGEDQALVTVACPTRPGTDSRIRLALTGPLLEASFNGVSTVRAEDGSLTRAGVAGVRMGGGGSQASVTATWDDFSVRYLPSPRFGEREVPILASGSGDGSVRLWDAGTGSELLVLAEGLPPVLSVAVSPDQRLVAAGGGDGTVSTWRLETADLVGTVPAHAGQVFALAFSPDSRLLASGGSDRTARLWDVGAGREVRRVGPFRMPAYSVAFRPGEAGVDDFDRADGDDLGPAWHEELGDWAISGGRLRSAAPAGAADAVSLAVYTETLAGEYSVEATVRAEAVAGGGQVAVGVVGQLVDRSHYHVAEVRPALAANQIRLVRVARGVEEVIGQASVAVSPGIDYRVRVTFGADSIRVAVDSAEVIRAAGSATPGPSRAGVRARLTGPVGGADAELGSWDRFAVDPVVRTLAVGTADRIRPFDAFLVNAAAGTFDLHGIDPAAAAVEHQNSLFMAVTHRFLGQDSPAGFQAVMGVLETAPDTFPNSQDGGHWDSVFRWLPGSPPASGRLFGDDFGRAQLGPVWLTPRGRWEIRAGRLHSADEEDGAVAVCVPPPPAENYKVRAAVLAENGAVAAGVVGRYRDPSNYYCALLRCGRPGRLRLIRVADGRTTSLADVDIDAPPGAPHALELEFAADRLLASIDGVAVLDVLDGRLGGAGRAGVVMGSGGGGGRATVAWDDFSVHASTAELYSGLDFMVALAVAGARHRVHNRSVFRTALGQ